MDEKHPSKNPSNPSKMEEQESKVEEQELFKQSTRFIFRRNRDVRLKREVMKCLNDFSPSAIIQAIWAAHIPTEPERVLIGGGAFCWCSSHLESKIVGCNIRLSDIHYDCSECHAEAKTTQTLIVCKKIESFQDIPFVTSELQNYYNEHNIGHFLDNGYDRTRPWEDYFWKLFGYKLLWKVFQVEMKTT